MLSLLSDFRLPNATTWFYLSLFLALIVFFRFARFWSLRNWDLLTLFALTPGLLMVNAAERHVRLVGDGIPGLTRDAMPQLPSWIQWGYGWLLLVGLYFVIRCLIDLFLTRRPHLEPNLNISATAFLGIVLLGFLVSEVMRKDPDPAGGAAAQAAAMLLEGQQVPDEPTLPHGMPMAVSIPLVPTGEFLAHRLSESEAFAPSDLAVAVGRTVVILCHLLIVTALVLIGWQHFANPHSGVAMATLYLMLPVTAMNVEKLDHVLPSVFLIWAVYSYRWPWLAGVLFGLAGEFFFPLFLIPLWVGFFWGRGGWKFLVAFLATSLVLAGFVYLFSPVRGFLEVWIRSVVWQVWDFSAPTTPLSFWTETTQIYRLPILILYIFATGLVAFWPREKNLGELLALSVVLIISLQFWYTDRGGAYLNWYLPVLLTVIYRPNLTNHRPTAPVSTGTWPAVARR